MKKLTLKKLFASSEDLINKEVFIEGWIKNIRISKEFGFIELNDGSCFSSIQVVFDNQLTNFVEVSKLSVGSSLSVDGTIVESLGKEQKYEVKASKIEIYGFASLKNPVQKKRHTYEFLRTIPHLRSRTNTYKAIFRVRSLIAHAIHEFFQSNDFIYIHTPIITGNDCEGAGQMFHVSTLDLNNLPRNEQNEIDFTKELLGKKTSLTVSGQLALEPFCFAFRNVYTFGPTFRAENSNTNRHANEFWMIEPEMAFAELEDNMEVAEAMLKYIINYILKNAPEEMEFFNAFIDNQLLKRLENITSASFGSITYTDAITELNKTNHKFEFPTTWGVDLQTEHERFLSEQLFNKPVFVTDYPKDIKAFYMKNNADNKTVRAMDLLVPEVGEIIGGSQREEDPNLLKLRMNEMGLALEEYEWYMDIREYGTFKHSGFGLGFERAVMYLTGMKNIRDVIPYPRTPNNAIF